ncbi:DNA-binding protein [Streptomyces sp. NBC_00258]|uniref:DNA-binding protein n=1 Tax=Streptomyces sp. NBC_00258 TaxID=2903642 RepID=UPI002E2CD126|nr:DNA-binding protein [Streptomyces sp. NBC_00258]
MSAWTREAVEALGPTTNVKTAASIVDIDPETVYAAIRREQWDLTRVLRIGRRILIPTLDLITLLYAPTDLAPTVPAQCQHDASRQVTGQQSQSQCGCTPTATGVVHQLRGA